MAKKAAAVTLEKLLRTIKIDPSHEHAEVLLLTCIDFRFFPLISRKMRKEGLQGKYDHFILAGASLGATLDFSGDHLPAPTPPDCKCRPLLPRLHWQQVFVEHLQLALQLHNTIHRVIIIEHRECGAYKAFLEPNGYATPAAERRAHKAQADKLEGVIKQHFKGLRVDKWLASLKPQAIGPLRMMDMESDAAVESLEIDVLN
jgi:hypothetical protein